MTEQNRVLHIKIDQERINHGILYGSNIISRKKEHFKGLMKTVKEQNGRNYSIDKRDPKSYEVT